jgi:hypothetical protein
MALVAMAVWPHVGAVSVSRILDEGILMKKLEVFDPSMCCSSGVCGVGVDPQLVQFAADLQWLAGQGVEVERHNLSQEPQAFFDQPEVVREMKAGLDHLPVLMLDGRIISTGLYLSRSALAEKLDIKLTADEVAEVKPATGCSSSKAGCC